MEYAKLQLTFFVNDQNLVPLLEGVECNGSLAACLNIMNKPLIVYNIDATNRALKGKITDVAIPRELKGVLDIVIEHYQGINITELNDEEDGKEDDLIIDGGAIDWSNGSIRLPINSIVRTSSVNSGADNSKISLDLITYPWNFLAAIQNILRDNITTTYISPHAKVSKTSVIEGPCIIEDNVVLDDFCKIKGPCYISEGSIVGMSSLVRSSMLGKKTRIGFNCEIAKSFFSGDAKIAHQNEILDSLIGKNVWFGGYSATANVLLTRENVKFQFGGNLVDTGTPHFGAVVGNNSSIGANVLILPGRQIPPNSMIQAGTIVKK